MFYNIEALSFFQKIKEGLNGKIVKGINSNYKDKDIQIRYSNKSFQTTFEDHRKPGKPTITTGKYFKSVIIMLNRKLFYILDGLFIDSHSPTVIQGSVNAIRNKGFTDLHKAYLKMVIPVKSNFVFRWTIEESNFSSDRVAVSRRGTKLNLYGEEIFIIIESDVDKNQYLIIESKKKQTFNAFNSKTHIIRIALGYLTGYYAGNEGCYFSYRDKKMEKMKGFKFQILRKEMKGLTQPVYANPFGWIKNKKIADKYYKQGMLQPISIDSFSCLCQKLHASEELLSSLLIILESSAASLILRPGGYAIALETLSDVIIGGKEERFAPITNKNEAGKFRKELSDILKKYSSSEYFKDPETLQKNIDKINQMTNKERLKAPFKVLNIELSDEDLNVINSRNDFLHGRIPDFKNLGASRSIEQKDRDLYYASVRLYTLLNMLILKFVGFDGYVVNYAKIYEKGTRYLCNEDYYRKV